MPSPGFNHVLSMILPAALPKPVQHAIAGPIGLRRIESLYQELITSADARAIPSRLLNRLQIQYRVSDKDLAHLPRTGPTMVVSNHPFGILDGAILSDLLLSVRSDVKLLANGILGVAREMRDLLIEVDPLSGAPAVSQNVGGLRKAYRHVLAGGLLAVFPAGEVSHFQWNRRGVEDSEWNNMVARLAAALHRHNCDATIVPIHIGGANSFLFQTAGVFHPRIRTVLLARELLNKRGREIEVRLGTPISSARLLRMASEFESTEYLRWRTYLLARRNPYKANTTAPIRTRRKNGGNAAVSPPVSPNALCDDIAALPSDSMLGVSGDLRVFLATARQIPAVLAEIGRLRELTFRLAGEGTGKSADIDKFDEGYEHLFVWNARTQEVVGAYRLAGTDIVQSRFGSKGLYTATLFDYSQRFLDQINPALELGRSFVRAEYQRTFAPLLLLWKGIGQYIARHPRYKVLFGPVSISNAYQSVSRELMVSWLERRASLATLKNLVTSKHPFRFRSEMPKHWLPEIEDLSDVVEDIEPDRRGVPVLLRHYLKLGGKLLCFNIDPAFSNALDGLILVDLTQTDPKILERYLGRAEAIAFRSFHKSACDQ